MISVRRLRATLMFAVLSAIGWLIVGTIMTIGISLVYGIPVTTIDTIRSAIFFVVFGLAAGAVWSVALAMLPRKRDDSVTASAAGFAGALGGLIIGIGLFGATGTISATSVFNLLKPLGFIASIGAVVGVLIQQTANRGRLPAPVDPPAIEGHTTHG